MRLSTQALRAGARTSGIIAQIISGHPVREVAVGDVGHEGIAAAVSEFRDAWSAELRRRAESAADAEAVLCCAADDADRVDALLAESASRLGHAS